MTFVDEMNRLANTTYTENGARAYKSTENVLLDLFARIGALRSADREEILNLWRDARAADKELADNMVLYARNIRGGGCGEKRVGRILLKELAKIDPAKVIRNFDTIVDCGRWDDLFEFIDTPVEDDMWLYVREQILKDVDGMRAEAPISLLAKWMPSINTSSSYTRSIARRACKKLDLTPRTYRKALSALRRYLDIVERRISAREWDKINFEAVPALAMNRYIKQFNSHCQERFEEYKESLKKGEAKINATTLYPYDLIMKYFNNTIDWDIANEQWKSLPNYVEEGDNVVVVADVSGSMTCDMYRPMATSIGLAIYFAQRNTGPYHNYFMTFSNNPEFCKIKDSWDLRSCITGVRNAKWGFNTNLDKTFKAIYDVAVKTRDVPKAIVICTDMQIDQCSNEDADSITEKWHRQFEEAGLPPVKLIYWNIASPKATFLAKADDNVSFISGYGTGAFKHLPNLIYKSAYEAMVEILNKPEFAWK